jgi:hypothetical protein
MLGEVITEAITNMLIYLVDVNNLSSGHKLFRNKFLLFMEDYSIIPSILAHNNDPSYSLDL